MERYQKLRSAFVHLIRVAVVIGLLWMIPPPQTTDLAESDGTLPPSIELIRKRLPAASSVSGTRQPTGVWAVQDSEGKTIASVARTLPEAADVIGYRGPTESMILLDPQLNILAVELIQSSDTKEHVEAVIADSRFFDQFTLWGWEGPTGDQSIDAVSGATLTSLALAQGVLKRIGGDRPSLVFPELIRIDEVIDWFPDVATLSSEQDVTDVLSSDGQRLGRVLRTGPLSDSVVGYQGPTELLIRLADSPSDGAIGEAVVEDIKLRSSFDNQPYVRYCKTEYGFWARFKERRCDSLAAMNLEEEGIEGVSGATMTSLAIAETIAVSMDRLIENQTAQESASAPSWYAGFRVSSRDAATVGLLLLVPLFRYRGWFRNRLTRTLWLLLVLGVIGLWTGNLISMALVAGWSAEGIAWQLAPGLAVLAVVAFVAPVVGKSNPYCNHICPHGALQQLIRPTKSSRRHWSPPPRVLRALRLLPGCLLVIAYVTLVFRPATDLSSWEPFHAYLFRIAPPTAMLLWLATMLFAAFVPMGYCRLGCPTGRLLDYLRRTRRSDRISRADAIALGLLLIATALRFGMI